MFTFKVRMIGGTPPKQHHLNQAAAFITNNKLCLQCIIFHSLGVVKEEQDFNWMLNILQFVWMTF